MTTPISLFDQLRQTYLRYLDSPFDLRYEPLVAERRAMLDRDGRLYREPLIEPVPPYISSGRTFDLAVAEILRALWPSTHISELTDSCDKAYSRPAASFIPTILMPFRPPSPIARTSLSQAALDRARLNASSCR
jgi:DEAD/DEAH box helicase domain-containing protein